MFLSTSNITVVVLKNNVCSHKNNTDLQRFKKILSARQRAATLLNSPAGDVPQLRRKPRKNLNKSLFKTCNRKVSNMLYNSTVTHTYNIMFSISLQHTTHQVRSILSGTYLQLQHSVYTLKE